MKKAGSAPNPTEQDMIKALIVNKFRGDRSIFRSGVEILEQRSGKPVAGVVPYVHCDIEDEDSLSAKLENRAAGLVDIAVIRLPRISNFTDLDVFSQSRRRFRPIRREAGAARETRPHRDTRHQKHHL